MITVFTFIKDTHDKSLNGIEYSYVNILLDLGHCMSTFILPVQFVKYRTRYFVKLSK